MTIKALPAAPDCSSKCSGEVMTRTWLMCTRKKSTTESLVYATRENDLYWQLANGCVRICRVNNSATECDVTSKHWTIAVYVAEQSALCQSDNRELFLLTVWVSRQGVFTGGFQWRLSWGRDPSEADKMPRELAYTFGV